MQSCCYKTACWNWSFDTTINLLYLSSQKRSRPCGNEPFSNPTILIKLPAQAPEFLNVSILYPIEIRLIFLEILRFWASVQSSFPCCSYGKQIR
jgi:hypothetical protein